MIYVIAVRGIAKKNVKSCKPRKQIYSYTVLIYSYIHIVLIQTKSWKIDDHPKHTGQGDFQGTWALPVQSAFSPKSQPRRDHQRNQKIYVYPSDSAISCKTTRKHRVNPMIVCWVYKFQKPRHWVQPGKPISAITQPLNPNLVFFGKRVYPSEP